MAGIISGIPTLELNDGTSVPVVSAHTPLEDKLDRNDI